MITMIENPSNNAYKERDLNERRDLGVMLERIQEQIRLGEKILKDVTREIEVLDESLNAIGEKISERKNILERARARYIDDRKDLEKKLENLRQMRTRLLESTPKNLSQ